MSIELRYYKVRQAVRDLRYDLRWRIRVITVRKTWGAIGSAMNVIDSFMPCVRRYRQLPGQVQEFVGPEDCAPSRLEMLIIRLEGRICYWAQEHGLTY